MREDKPAWSSNGRLALALVGIAALLGFGLAVRNWPREHDRHMVASRVRELERSLRSQGSDLSLFVEGRDEAILRDFERLRKLDGLTITLVEVQIDGDKALATYRIEAAARRGERIPQAGELEFVRGTKGWQVAGHRFVE